MDQSIEIKIDVIEKNRSHFKTQWPQIIQGLVLNLSQQKTMLVCVILGAHSHAPHSTIVWSNILISLNVTIPLHCLVLTLIFLILSHFYGYQIEGWLSWKPRNITKDPHEHPLRKSRYKVNVMNSEITIVVFEFST